MESLKIGMRLPKLGWGIRKYGFSFLALLYASKTDRVFVHFSDISYAYSDLLEKAVQQAFLFYREYGVQKGEKVVLIGNQTPEWMISLLALSGLGTRISLLNPKLNRTVVQEVICKMGKAKVFIDAESQAFLQLDRVQVIELRSSGVPPSKKFLRALAKSRSSVVNLTSGTAGQPKEEKRSLNPLPYIGLFFGILKKLRLAEDKNTLIGIPCTHGYGLAALLIALGLRKEIYLAKTTAETYRLLKEKPIDCWISLPSQLQGFFVDNEAFCPPKIITGSEPIAAELVTAILDRSCRLYNLYGTTETGVIGLATPQILRKSPQSIGKPLRGIDYRLEKREDGDYEVLIKSPWSGDKNRTRYVATGDKISLDQHGYWIYKGRVDKKLLIKGHLVDLRATKNLLKKHLTETEIRISVQENQLHLHLIHLKKDSDLNKSELLLKRLLPAHLQPFYLLQEVEG